MSDILKDSLYIPASCQDYALSQSKTAAPSLGFSSRSGDADVETMPGLGKSAARPRPVHSAWLDIQRLVLFVAFCSRKSLLRLVLELLNCGYAA